MQSFYVQKYFHVVDESANWYYLCVCVCVPLKLTLWTHDTIFRRDIWQIYVNIFNVYTFDPEILGIYFKKAVTNMSYKYQT